MLWKKTISKKVKGFITLLLVLATGAYFYPANNAELQTIVVGMPALSSQPSLPPYRGAHPSAVDRPEETFPFPINLGQLGPSASLFAGPLQYPFLCGVRDSGLGQPLIDNYQQWGVPVYGLDKQGYITNTILGYSKDCMIPTQASYYYNRQGTENFVPLSEVNNDIAKIVVNGKTIDFIVRIEIGTINRFLYIIAALKGEDESLAQPNGSHWNGKLIYQFRGGVGIGYRQGRATPSIIFKRRHEQLSQGYAVVYSSGTQTSNHYNMWLSEDTALRVKRQFSGLYGKPQYTIGIGGSGGAVQQYLLSQNNPDIIDAAIAEYAYPDMVTQTLYAMDCELLEYYFDVIDRDNPRWQQWQNRQLIEGLNTSETLQSKYRWLQRLSQLKLGVWPSWNEGESECVKSWRGLTPLVHNPRFTHLKKHYDPAVVEQVHWTHWNDLKHIYGTDEHGYGFSTWDNVGVQYGLNALINDNISIEEFLKLNASVGGWKTQQQMRKEHYWFLNQHFFPIRVSVWSHRNMRTGSLAQPAVRSEGNLEAMQAAYRSGHIFLGHLNIPVIDLRHYLEPELDMHHLSSSLSVRKRLLREQGHADNHLIWVTQKPHKGEVEAFALLDQWLQGSGSHRPAQAVDTCFAETGEIIASGAAVWDDSWNQQPTGSCSRVYPAYSVSRRQAGADIAGDILKCFLQPVEQAIKSRVYGDQDMRPYLGLLKRIFPDGVCDYARGDRGRPPDLLANSRLLPRPRDLQQQKRAVGSIDHQATQSVKEPIELSLNNKDSELLLRKKGQHL
ncbi:MAG: DUF6351 family protein [Pseudomonadales bacterium]